MSTHQPDDGVEPGRALALADRLRESGDEQAAALLAERSRGRTWLGGIPVATEAIVDVMLQFLQQYPEGSDSPIQLAPSTIEPPSALLAFHSVFPRAEFHPQAVEQPDIRVPLYPGEGMAVWRYEGLLPRPAVAPPSPQGAARVQALAVPVWPHIPAIHQRARELSDVPLDDLLGVLVHPPAQPDTRPGEPGGPPDAWLRSVQVMACLGITWHQVDQPWRGSDRARVLSELCLGPEDWVTEAALFAMVAAAWMDPELRADVGATVGFRWFKAEEAAHTRAVTILGSLTELVLACPWLDPRITDRARDMQARLRQTDPEQPSPDELARLAAIARSHAPDTPVRAPRRFRFRGGE